VDAFTRALQKAPDEVDSIVGLGLSYFGLGEYESAHDQFLHALDIEPDNEVAQILCAESEYVLDPKYDIGDRIEASGSDPSSQVEARACLIRGSKLSEQGRYSEAAAQYLRALDFAPTSTEALNNLANAYHMIGEHDKARAALKKARLLAPESKLIERNLQTLGSADKPTEQGERRPLELSVPGKGKYEPARPGTAP
jgi:tetratricopeptide (TPR) repeat protein